MFGANTTPLALPESSTSIVSRIFVVATAANLADHATILFAGTSFWLESNGDAATIAMALPNGSYATIDGIADGQFVPESRFLLEVALANPVRACDVFIGGHAASPLWRRGWRGPVHEVVMLGPGSPDAGVAALRAFLSRYWDTPNPPPSPEGIRAILNGMGVQTHGFYGTCLVIQ